MKNCIKIGTDFLIGLCLCFLLIPVKWVLAWIFAAAVHECFHLLAVKFFGGEVKSISVRVFGAQIQVELNGNVRRILSILSGPLGGLCLVMLADIFPRIAVCGFLQSVFNLLPVYPLDGAKILSGGLEAIFGERSSARICACVSQIILFLILIASLYCAVVLKLGLLPVIASLLLLIRYRKKALQTLVVNSTIRLQETNEVSL